VTARSAFSFGGVPNSEGSPGAVARMGVHVTVAAPWLRPLRVLVWWFVWRSAVRGPRIGRGFFWRWQSVFGVWLVFLLSSPAVYANSRKCIVVVVGFTPLFTLSLLICFFET
jgi:hypothetical protein